MSNSAIGGRDENSHYESNGEYKSTHYLEETRVIGIYHANIWAENAAIPGGRDTRRMDFLWVRWFGIEPGHRSGSRKARLPKIGFVESTDDYAFSFVDPNLVIRVVHVIPSFKHGRTRRIFRSTPAGPRTFSNIRSSPTGRRPAGF